MNEKQALAKMVFPSMPRKSAWMKGIIQIWVTRACDKSCFGCTQASNLKGPYEKIAVEQYEQAVISLKDYFGVVGMFGGNPALHPEFPALCEILEKHIPFQRRGLWCNNPLGYAELMRKTFNPEVSNLNVHLDQKAYDAFKAGWPESRPFGLDADSRHAPGWTALRDLVPDESERWEKISTCDINQYWSAMIGVFRGELRAWFCEFAGAQAMRHQYTPEYPDTGLPVAAGWWRQPAEAFVGQVRKHCHDCGFPLRGFGSLAQDETGREQVTVTHADIYKPRNSQREVELVQLRSQLSEEALKSTVDYIGNAKK